MYQIWQESHRQHSSSLRGLLRRVSMSASDVPITVSLLNDYVLSRYLYHTTLYHTVLFFFIHTTLQLNNFIYDFLHKNPSIRPRSYFLSISDKILRRLTILSLIKFLSYFQITCILLIIFSFWFLDHLASMHFFLNLTQFISCWFLTDTIFELISAGYFSESKSEVRVKIIFILEIFTNFIYLHN